MTGVVQREILRHVIPVVPDPKVLADHVSESANDEPESANDEPDNDKSESKTPTKRRKSRFFLMCA